MNTALENKQIEGRKPGFPDRHCAPVEEPQKETKAEPKGKGTDKK